MHAAPDPTTQFRPFLEKVMDKLNDPELQKMSKTAQAQEMVQVVRQGFDFVEMSKRVLVDYWYKRSPAEQEEFVQLFTEYLQYTYVDKIEEYTGQQVQFIGQRTRGKRAEIQTELSNGERSINVNYILHLENGQWMAYDVVIAVADGQLSLVLNYRKEFQGDIQREGYSKTVEKLKNKIAELAKQYRND